MFIDILLIIFLLKHFISTITLELNILPKFFNKISIFSIFIPGWSFFSPTPIQSDVLVLYRLISNSIVSPWKESYVIKERNSVYSFIWNPRKLFLSGIINETNHLMDLLKKCENPRSIVLSFPYLCILQFVTSLIDDKSSSDSIQFVIVKRIENHSQKTIFLSSPHPIC